MWMCMHACIGLLSYLFAVEKELSQIRTNEFAFLFVLVLFVYSFVLFTCLRTHSCVCQYGVVAFFLSLPICSIANCCKQQPYSYFN